MQLQLWAAKWLCVRLLCVSCVSHRSPLKYITRALLIGGGNDGKRQQARYCSVIYHQCLGSAAGWYGETGWNHVSHRTIIDIKRWQLQVRLQNSTCVALYRFTKCQWGIREILHCHLWTQSVIFICPFPLSLSFCLNGQHKVNCGFSGCKNTAEAAERWK